MKKTVLLLSLVLCGNIAFAEQYPIKIIPAQKISTCYDEIETGDRIKFTVSNDVYKNNKIYIKKGSPINGTVDYIAENGWVGDNAEIQLKNFRTNDINGKEVKLNSELTINGFEELKYQYPKTTRFFNYLSSPIRGKEININPETDKSTYTIWLKY